MLTHLDLFSGIGGFAVAAQMVGGIETTQFVEINPYCQKVLTERFPGVPIHDDITTFTAIPRQFDFITAGWPCTDISRANARGKGLTGERSGLFFEIIRILRNCRPRYLLLENSPALLNFRGGRDMGAILWELSACGYDADWSIVSACSVGAPHTRERLFIVAYPNGINGPVGLAVHPQHEELLQAEYQKTGISPWSEAPPHSSGMVNGLSNRTHRVVGLGNAVVPQVAAIALQKVLNMEADRQWSQIRQ
ncbi:MAG: DNA (cytosine-5-)-methyltransferase [Cyanobacteria bacterium P01_A01_bin.17]